MSAPAPVPYPVPEALARELAGYDAAPVAKGCSAASVFRLTAVGKATLFLKVEPAGAFSELSHEADRLQWLGGIGIPCPHVVHFAQDRGRNWLLTRALRGRDLSCASDLPPVQIASIAADALQALHAFPPAECRFAMRLDLLLAGAAERVAAGLVDEQDFEPEHLGRSATDLMAELLSRPRPEEDLVLAHGDACLPNLVASGDRFDGFVDCARLGVSDRYRDLALAARSIAANLGAEFCGPFFSSYGIEPDREKLAYYRLLDEFF